MEINPIEDMLQFEPQAVKQVQKTKVDEHVCFSCGQSFPVSDGVDWCPVCHWAKCPECGNCACTLTHEAQMALRGVWLTFCQHCNNPCKRKARPKKIVNLSRLSREDMEKRIANDVRKIKEKRK